MVLPAPVAEPCLGETDLPQGVVEAHLQDGIAVFESPVETDHQIGVGHCIVVLRSQLDPEAAERTMPFDERILRNRQELGRRRARLGGPRVRPHSG